MSPPVHHSYPLTITPYVCSIQCTHECHVTMLLYKLPTTPQKPMHYSQRGVDPWRSSSPARSIDNDRGKQTKTGWWSSRHSALICVWPLYPVASWHCSHNQRDVSANIGLGWETCKDVVGYPLITDNPPVIARASVQVHGVIIHMCAQSMLKKRVEC